MKKILIIDNDTVRIKDLARLVSKKYLCEIAHYGNVNLQDISGFDLVILSGGSKHSVLGNEKIYHNEFEIIKQSPVPVMGICLGHQLISYAFNMKINLLPEKRKGLKKIEILDQDFFTPFNSIEVYEAHRYAVVLEKGWGGSEFDILAQSDDGIEAMKYKTREIYSFQFHPEMFPDILKSDEIFFEPHTEGYLILVFLFFICGVFLRKKVKKKRGAERPPPFLD